MFRQSKKKRICFIVKILETVDPGNGLKEIDNYTFYHSGAKRIRIPDSTTEVGKCAFAGVLWIMLFRKRFERH